MVLLAATISRGSMGRPSESPPSTKAQPRARSNGGLLRPRRFCAPAASPSSAGPNTANRKMASSITAEAKASLSRQSMASRTASPVRGTSAGLAEDRSVMAGLLLPDARIEHAVRDVDQDVHDENGDGRDHDGSQHHVEVSL